MFDSHCHLTDERLRGDVAGVLARARAVGVTGVVSIASDAEDGAAANELARSFPDVWSTAGIHPHAAGDAIAADRELVEDLITRPRVVALGETGLDYYYDTAPRSLQCELFAWHLEHSARTGLPTVVHSRDAEVDTAAVMREANRNATGVLHCFSAGKLLFDTALELDWYVSFGGMVTFKNFAGHDFLRAVPSHRLLLETDSPYLAPVPMRGKQNEPAYVAYICAAAAALRGVSADELGRVTDENARRFYRLASFT
ncbi:MAG: TatD family hydrolase [Longimicrobiales bacterium]